MKNFGLLISKEARAKDWISGGVTGIIDEPLVIWGNWDEYLPEFEPQSVLFDTMSCVSFSALNCLEALYKRKYRIEENFSDRFIAKMSGTTVMGNYMETVAETIRKVGLVEEAVYPWGGNNWVEYMQDVPEDVVQRATASLGSYKVNWEWVLESDVESLKNALTYSPLQVTVYAWGKKKGDIYQKTSTTPNHAVMLYGYEDGIYWKIYDHYLNEFKKVTWDFFFGHRLRYNIENSMPTPKIANNLLVQLVEEGGGFALSLDGKLIIDDLDKLIAVWLVRNDGDVKGKTLAVKSELWDSLVHINLKKEIV